MTLEKNKREGNILKKFSFIFVILGAVLAHFIIKEIPLDGRSESTALLILWFMTSAIVFNMVLYNFNKAYKDGWDDSKKGEFDIVGINGKKTDKRIRIEENGVFSEGLVEKVSEVVMGQNFAAKAIYSIITYSFFNKDDNKIIKIKKYNKQLLENIPTVGDKIKIIYDELNPKDSVIFHEDVSWNIKLNKLQSKQITITLTNNIKSKT